MYHIIIEFTPVNGICNWHATYMSCKVLHSVVRSSHSSHLPHETFQLHFSSHSLGMVLHQGWHLTNCSDFVWPGTTKSPLLLMTTAPGSVSGSSSAGIFSSADRTQASISMLPCSDSQAARLPFVASSKSESLMTLIAHSLIALMSPEPAHLMSSPTMASPSTVLPGSD